MRILKAKKAHPPGDIIKKLFVSRRAQVGIQFAMAWIFFNMIIIIMIYAFGNDSVTIGTYSSSSVNIDDNTSTTTDLSIAHATGFISSFRAGISGLPWWLNLLLGMIDISFLALIIYALIRGM